MYIWSCNNNFRKGFTTCTCILRLDYNTTETFIMYQYFQCKIHVCTLILIVVFLKYVFVMHSSCTMPHILVRAEPSYWKMIILNFALKLLCSWFIILSFIEALKILERIYRTKLPHDFKMSRPLCSYDVNGNTNILTYMNVSYKSNYLWSASTIWQLTAKN